MDNHKEITNLAEREQAETILVPAMALLKSAKDGYQQSDEYKKYAIMAKAMLGVLKDSGPTLSIQQLLHVERLIVLKELDNTTNTQQKSSSTKAITGLEECQVALDSLSQNPEGYKEVTDKSYGADKRQKNLPLDASRLFLKSHYARLDNYMRCSEVGSVEGHLLEQRKKNIKIIQDGYIKLQENALGIPSKDKGLSR